MQTNRASPNTHKQNIFSFSPPSYLLFTKSGISVSLFLFLALSLNLDSVQGQYFSTPQDITNLNENQLYSGFFQEERSFKFFSVAVSNTYFDTSKYMAFKVMASGYLSDPDIFISKGTIPLYPTSSNTSDYYCGKIGSDTCVIAPTSINYQDVFYFGIRCIDRCNYDLKIQYMKVTLLTDATAYNAVLDGQNSLLFSYYVPASAANGFTSSVMIQAYGTNTYTPIDIFISTDNVIYQIEEKSNQVVYSKGMALKYTSNNYNFCTQCYLYILIDFQFQDNYYITMTASARSEVLQSGYSKDIVVLNQQYECFQYSVQQATRDVFFYVTTFQGTADVYLSYQNYPKLITESTVKFISTIYDKRTLLLTPADRTSWNYPSGIYYICMNAYLDTSLSVTVYEVGTSTQYTLYDDNEFNVRVQPSSNIQFIYSHTDLLVSPGTIQVTLIVTPSIPTTNPPKIFYKLCSNTTVASCYLNRDEAQGRMNQTVREIGVVIQSDTTKTAFISHDPSMCPSKKQCYYLFAVASNNTANPIQVAMIVNHTKSNIQSVAINQAYVNVLDYLNYQYYSIIPAANPSMQFMSAIKINLISYQGDADLYVSTSTQFPSINNYEYMSNLIGSYDQVIINESASMVNMAFPIYIAVYASTRVSFQINFTPYYVDQYNVQLQGATPTYEKQGNFTYLANQYAQAFYSYTPWWAGSEQRDIIFYTKEIFNDVQLYASADSMPISTQSQYIGQNNTIVVPANPSYSAKSSTYFIKIIPNFALYDLVSNRQFVCYFFAFSQRAQGQMSDIQVNDARMAFANGTHNYYRHFMEYPTGTYTITLNVEYGAPVLLIGISGDQPLYPTYGNYSSYLYLQNVQTVKGQQITSQTISAGDRVQAHPSCTNNQPGYYLNGGNPACTFYIGVYCPYTCLYNLSISIQQMNPNYTIVPGYLLENDYVTGYLAPNKSAYYYFPVSNQTGETTFFLNKTQIQGYQNGDMSLSMVVLNDTGAQFSTFSINNWYWYYFSGYSYSSRPNQPELIEICGNTFQKFCLNYSSCAVLLGVHSKSITNSSFFRLKAITDRKKLLNMQPVMRTLNNANDYHYYYFTNNLTVTNPSSFWEFTVSLAILTPGGDADLFISAVDGRNPSHLDFDFASQRNGADNIYISSNTKFFTKANYNIQNGILFVVGVRALTQNVQYSLMVQGPTRNQYTFTEINFTSSQTFTFKKLAKTSPLTQQAMTYKWFNYGSDNFQVVISATAGSVYGNLNFYSASSYLSTIYSSIPVNENNSLWTTFVNTTQSQTLRVFKTGSPGLFCYFCWYYITIFANQTTVDNTFSLSIQRLADSGASIPLININEQQTVQIKSAQSLSQSKVMFECKSAFSISLTVTAGSVIMYVGLYPDAPTAQAAWTSPLQGVGSYTLSVRQTDAKFVIGAWYYITFVAQTGNTQYVYKVNQYKQVSLLQNGVTIKDQYFTEEEQVKFYALKAPLGTYKVSINVTGISNNFYPLIYQIKANLTKAPSDFRTLNYSNFTYFSNKFGDDVSSVMNLNSFNYQFTDTATTNFTYQLFTVYANTFGLTDLRKQAFSISISTTSVTLKQEPMITSLDELQELTFDTNEFDNLEDDRQDLQVIQEQSSVRDALNWIKQKVAATFRFQKNDY